MLKFFRATSLVAVSCILVSAVFTADASFAFGNDQGTYSKANTATVDATQIAAERAQLDLAKSGKVTATIADNGDDALSAASLADLVDTQDVRDSLSNEERCLAGAVYFESKGESLTGQLAVARVILARANSGRFPSTLCGVVFQKSQFSFVRGAGMPPVRTGSKGWQEAVAISKIALNDSWKSPVEGALFFHARHVTPGWNLTRIGSIDNHIFYR
ncbi:cell wall hydrolase [Sphingorhabdus sp.]|jgi:spore germination cell wall hydrolase CwlJ-like protein|uniref:cell wall hydrolase n=1 Tax=Sphingorhabdus sp. TaxID=1902408 RepID=UPI0037CC73DB